MFPKPLLNTIVLISTYLLFFIAGKAWAQTLGIKNATVYRMSGLQKVDEYQIVNGEEVREKKLSREDEELLDN